MEKEILEAKKKLYSSLLEKGDNITDNELNIIGLLAKDKQVREIFEKK